MSGSWQAAATAGASSGSRGRTTTKPSLSSGLGIGTTGSRGSDGTMPKETMSRRTPRAVRKPRMSAFAPQPGPERDALRADVVDVGAGSRRVRARARRAPSRGRGASPRRRCPRRAPTGRPGSRSRRPRVPAKILERDPADLRRRRSSAMCPVRVRAPPARPSPRSRATRRSRSLAYGNGGRHRKRAASSSLRAATTAALSLGRAARAGAGGRRSVPAAFYLAQVSHRRSRLTGRAGSRRPALPSPSVVSVSAGSGAGR